MSILVDYVSLITCKILMAFYWGGVKSTVPGVCGYDLKSAALSILGGSMEMLERPILLVGKVEARDGVPSGVVVVDRSTSESSDIAVDSELVIAAE
jgi:hypothetical protein